MDKAKIKNTLNKYEKEIYETHFSKFSEKAMGMPKQEWNKLVALNKLPFDFLMAWIDVGILAQARNSAGIEDGEWVSIDKNSDENYGNFAMLVHKFIENDKFRCVDLEGKIIPLIETTDNTHFYRHIPFNSFFINQRFIYGNWIILGILVADLQFFDVKDCFGNERPEDLGLFFLAVRNNGEGDELFNYIYLQDSKITDTFQGYDKSEMEEIRHLRNYVRTIVANLIDFIETEKEYDMTERPLDKLHNEKRIKRGKTPIPAKIFIKLNGRLKIKAEDFEERTNRLGFSHQFLVRGFWRHFRSMRYKNARNKKLWIYPFYRGVGEIITKTYEVKE